MSIQPRRWSQVLLLLSCCLTSPFFAAEFRVLLDLDASQATGCTVSTVAGNFAGVEQLLVTTVDTLVYPAETKLNNGATPAEVVRPRASMDVGGGYPEM